jgi:phage terminase small subunit
MVLGRNAEPVSLIVAKGKKHLTKAEIESRQRVEIKLGDEKIICPTYIKSNKLAYEKWKEIDKIYKEVDFVSSGDAGLLGRYCMTHGEYLELLKRRSAINNIASDCDDVQEYIENTEAFDTRVKSKLLDMISTAAILQLETAINKKMDMLIKMEDRLFLNPLAKVKNIPKQEPVIIDPVKNRFGNL